MAFSVMETDLNGKGDLAVMSIDVYEKYRGFLLVFGLWYNGAVS